MTSLLSSAPQADPTPSKKDANENHSVSTGLEGNASASPPSTADSAPSPDPTESTMPTSSSSSSSSSSAALKQRHVHIKGTDAAPLTTETAPEADSADRCFKSLRVSLTPSLPSGRSAAAGTAPPSNVPSASSAGPSSAVPSSFAGQQAGSSSNVTRRGSLEAVEAPRSRVGSIRAGTMGEEGDMQIFSPKVIVDGTKLILRLGRNETFVIDRPCKLLMVTSRVKIDRPLGWQISGSGGDVENTVVIDSGLIGHPFVPIPLAHYGTVYTRDGTVHVVVGSSIHRAKVHSRFLPYRTCNKFHSVTVLEKEELEEAEADTVTEWFIERQMTNNTLASIDPSHATKLIKHLTNDTQSGVVYIRADDSIMRYKLRHEEKVELHSGCLVAWTVGVRFEQSNYCCFRFVSAVHGEGTIWIQNSKTRALTAGV